MTDLAHSPAAPAPGRVLGGRYRLEALIGRGGYASVYRAIDEHLERAVAVKVFTASTADGTDRARVASETRVLASLTHPSLVTLFDARLDEDPSYFVMELIDGPTLSERIADSPLDPDTAASVAADLAEALHVIHARGIVHRDVKPSNVLLRPAPMPSQPPRATLADFGIAYLIDSARVTATGTLIGTAAYLSPEQARGETPTAAADVYALGLVLLESLTGRRAYAQATPHEALVARLVRSPEVPAALPHGWRVLLSAMTAMDPAHRPDAHAIQRAAVRLKTEESGGWDPTAVTIPAPRAEAGPHDVTDRTAVLPADETSDVPLPARPSRRRAMWLIAAAVLVVAGLVAAVLAATMWGGSPAPDPTLPALPEPLGEHMRQLLDEVSP
ncbi:serine/threonine protein kinase [Microbacterium lushaniae]|nr:serine/threonine protein kinase [Microbacterium lushaniae]KAA9152003.1 serine/threonine protein kinase [Microbacterium lushaniae]